jgi:hypothetical protein
MKFFSNESKETDDPDRDRDQHGDVVTSDPVAVPQQRAGSPWSDAPGSTDTAPQADTLPATGTGYESTDSDSRGTDSGDADSTVVEAGSPDDELAEQELRDGTDEEPAARRDGTVTTYGPDGTVTERSADDDLDLSLDSDSPRDDSTRTDDDSPHADDDSARTDDADALRRDDGDTAGTDDVDSTGTEAGSLRGDDGGEHRAEDAAVQDAAVQDKGTFDSPQAVEPGTGEPLSGSSDTFDDDENARDRAAAEAEAQQTIDEERADERQAELDGQPVAVEPEPVPGAAAATPGGAPATALDRLFTDGDSFADRFRDIQLRFVDSPKEATAEAAALVGEAVDKLTDALRAQKDALGGNSDDTEQLRVQLRSYRDLLNRLSAL